MKIPVKPPKYDFKQLVTENIGISDIFQPTTAKGEYLHWDKLRHLAPPENLSSEQWWMVIKLARKAMYKYLPFNDKNGISFVLAMTDEILDKLHTIDRSAGHTIQSSSSILNTQMRDTYLIRSLIEEAITSSQLEGASTTRKVAKEMLRTKRKPRNLSEQMIYNNYQAMQFVREMKDEELTVKIILELHRILTKDTLENLKDVGRLRTTDDIHVWDNPSQILHTPPKAAELHERLERICQFANAMKIHDKFFIHPVIKAIILHFMLAYDHSFVDGNGRTARALFYWSMANQDYWLMEFISISKIIKLSPGKYAYAYLYTETDDNDMTYFIIYQLNVILQAIEKLYDYLNKQSQEIHETEKLLYSNSALRNKLNYRQIAIIKHALTHPNMQYKIQSHRQSHNVTYDTARTDLLNLVKYGLLLKQKIGKTFVFAAPADLKERITRIN